MLPIRTRRSVAAAIEATALAPTTSEDDVRQLCAAALVHGVRGVCVPREHTPVAVAEVAGSGLVVVTVAGFPGGEHASGAKVREIVRAAEAGADEVDVVCNHRQLVAGLVEQVARDVDAAVRAADEVGLTTKIIIETGALTPELVDTACELCIAAGAGWVKTSTGFGPRGASVDDVVRIRAAVGDRARVKAAGGIRTWEQAVALLDAGADALGCSGFVQILEQAPR